MTVDTNEARISVLEAGYIEHATNIKRLDDKIDATGRRLEHKLDSIDSKLANRMPREDARAMARVWTICGIFATGFTGALLHIAVNL